MTYFSALNKYKNNDYIKYMEEYASNHKVPILKEEGLDLLVSIIKMNNVKNILEIGTAIGYSSSVFALINKDIRIDTIERDELMYQEALKNINALGLESQINIIFEDDLNVDLSTLKLDQYDLIFIDAAKSQYTNFFTKFEVKLRKGGIIFSDNLLFHGLVENASGKESRNLNQMLRKIRAYNEWLSNNEAYDTTFLRIGDGIAISIKK
jgi:predicted O-methyltransferase YrrM